MGFPGRYAIAGFAAPGGIAGTADWSQSSGHEKTTPRDSERIVAEVYATGSGRC
ncbi:hypothetical protein [Streptomyces sp. NPDC102462]|uniref:hypothetical protein n=1 Tax=Streptomyces sp. NPDC102462 TaxID=3366178 RepID=UPI00380EEDF4